MARGNSRAESELTNRAVASAAKAEKAAEKAREVAKEAAGKDYYNRLNDGPIDELLSYVNRSSAYRRPDGGYLPQVGYVEVNKSDHMALLKKVAGMAEQPGNEKLNKAILSAKDEIATRKARVVAEKLVKKGDDFGDKVTNEGPKAQKLADKIEKIDTKARAAADKYFGAKDKKGVNAQKNKEKMKALMEKKANAIPLEVRMAIQQLSGHNLGNLASAGVNALKYQKQSGKISGGDTGYGEEQFEYRDWSDLRYEARRGGVQRKSGNVTYKGVTYEWEAEQASYKIGYDPKQFAVQDKITIRAGVGSNRYQSPAPKRTIFEGEELTIEGG